MFILLCIVHFLVFVTASVIFEDCGSAYDLHRVNIRGCGTRLPCYITLDDNVPVTMEFFADFVSRNLDQDVTIQINFISSRTYVTPDPCATVHCPVLSDVVTSFTSVMRVPTNVAVNQRGFLQWRVYNDEKRLVLCYSVLVQTQTRAQKFLRDYENRRLNTLPVKHPGYNWDFQNAENDRIHKVMEQFYKKSKVK